MIFPNVEGINRTSPLVFPGTCTVDVSGANNPHYYQRLKMLRILSRYYVKKHSFLNCFKKHLTTASEESPVLSKVTEEGITVITINRPEKRNCVNFETAKLLKTAFEEFDADNNSYCAVLYGKGGNFCAGYDLEELSNFENTENRTYDLDSFRGPMVIIIFLNFNKY